MPTKTPGPAAQRTLILNGADTLFQRMVATAALHPKMLAAYRDDLMVHDRRVAERAEPGEQYVWLLRPCGSEMIRVGAGLAPETITHWIGTASTPDDVVTFRIDVGAGGTGEVKPISHQEACRLAQTPLSVAEVQPGACVGSRQTVDSERREEFCRTPPFTPARWGVVERVAHPASGRPFAVVRWTNGDQHEDHRVPGAETDAAWVAHVPLHLLWLRRE